MATSVSFLLLLVRLLEQYLFETIENLISLLSLVINLTVVFVHLIS